MQNKILVVDGDTRSLRLLEVSLSQVGYRVVTATSGADALGQLEVEVPDLVLADTDIGAVDGFALYQRLQARPEWAHLPFIFILDGENPAEKLRAVQLGASDFLTKPVFLKEALSRVELLLEKHAQRGDGGPGAAISSGRERFAGALSGTALLDLLQTMELGRKSGIAYCTSGRGQRAVLYFADGAVVDAELARLRGEEALYRVLTFQGGEYRVELLTVVRPRRIELGTAGLLMEAMRYLEEWNRLGAALPPLTTALSQAALAGGAGALRPEMLPAELREVLWRFHGQRSVLDVLELMDEEAAPPHDALRRLGVVAKLYAARLLVPAGRPISGEPRASALTPAAGPRLTPPPLPPVSRLTPPPLPRLTPPPFVAGRPSAMAGMARPTPVALPRAVVFTPSPLSQVAHHYPGDLPMGPGSAAPVPARLTFSSDVPTGPLAMPPVNRVAASAEVTTGPMTLPQLSSPAHPPSRAAATAASDDSLTPLPRHFPPHARHTPVELMSMAPTARLTPPPLPQVRLPPPPLPGRGLFNTPPLLHTAGHLTPLPITDSMVPPLPVRPERNTPPSLQAAPLQITDSMVQPLPVRPERPTSPSLQVAPLPITDSMVQPLPVRPERPTSPSLQAAPLQITDSMVEVLPVRPGSSTPPSLQVAPLQITDSMVEALPVRPERSTPPALRVAPRLTPPPVSEATWADDPSRPLRTTPPALRVAPRLTPPPLAAGPRLTPAPGSDSDSSLDPSASSQGRNLARLAQRLAATRQPLPFTPPPMPIFTPALENPGSQPNLAAAQLWTGGASGGHATAPAAAVSWIGSAPELEPISIPEFESAAIEHAAPSWGQAAESADQAAPQRELRIEKTLSVHSRPQRIAADSSQAAVHISAPVRLPAEMASTALPPIELDPAPRPRPPVATPPSAAEPRQRLSRAVLWLAAGAALFGLGVLLFLVRQEFDRSATDTSRESTGAPTTASAPKTTNEAASPPIQDPLPSPTPTPATGTEAANATPAPNVTASETPPAAVAPTPAAVEPAAAPPANAPTPTVVAQNPVDPTSGSAPAVPEPTPAVPAPNGEYAALITKAQAFERRGALQPAHHAVRDAQRLNPRGAEVFALLAQLALDEGSADKAAGLAKRAVLADANNADAYLVLGTVEQARAHSAKARAYFKKYLALAPTGDRAHDVRAVLRMSH